MPESHVRLSAGRETMNEQTQSLCFLAGANSIFFGCKLLTTANAETNSDIALFEKLGINTESLPGELAGETEAALKVAISDGDDKELFYPA